MGPPILRFLAVFAAVVGVTLAIIFTVLYARDTHDLQFVVPTNCNFSSFVVATAQCYHEDCNPSPCRRRYYQCYYPVYRVDYLTMDGQDMHTTFSEATRYVDSGVALQEGYAEVQLYHNGKLCWYLSDNPTTLILLCIGWSLAGLGFIGIAIKFGVPWWRSRNNGGYTSF